MWCDCAVASWLTHSWRLLYGLLGRGHDELDGLGRRIDPPHVIGSFSFSSVIAMQMPLLSASPLGFLFTAPPSRFFLYLRGRTPCLVVLSAAFLLHPARHDHGGRAPHLGGAAAWRRYLHAGRTRRRSLRDRSVQLRDLYHRWRGLCLEHVELHGEAPRSRGCLHAGSRAHLPPTDIASRHSIRHRVTVEQLHLGD